MAAPHGELAVAVPGSNSSPGREAPPWLAELEAAFAERFGFPQDGRLCDPTTIQRLRWVLDRLDRYAVRGEGRAGAGVSVLLGRLDGHVEAVRWDGAPVPRSLAYFIPALRSEARRWKHTWAPQIKAQRVAAGVRPPRRCAPPRIDYRRQPQVR